MLFEYLIDEEKNEINNQINSQRINQWHIIEKSVRYSSWSKFGESIELLRWESQP